MARRTASLWLAPLVLGATLPAPPQAWRVGDDPWRGDVTWHDGLAERAVYRARRTIYGLPRAYVATAYTNKQHMDPRTTTKAQDPAGGVEVFKHHWSERVPTERYDYDFSTATFTRSEDLAPFKLTVGTQEDCGASFKSAWRDGDGLEWLESVYFPDAGLRRGRIGDADAVHFEDALSLVLRDYPFDRPRAIELQLVPAQKSTRSVPFQPVRHVVRHAGREVLDLPVGRIDAHHLVLAAPGGAERAHYWFAAEAAPPWLHVLVRYEGPEGQLYELESLERTAYWERP